MMDVDIDNEIDQNLLQQFSCLGTTDRDVLISQLQKLVGNQLTTSGCAFFLDMNNWNLQAAVCSYYDLESPKDRPPTMAFVRDVTIGEGESVPPNTKFIKTWRLQNSGDEAWPPGCSLKFAEGDRMGMQDQVMVDALKPLEMADVSVEMLSPDKAGIYQGQWRMCTATGTVFGEIIWMIVTVAEGGTLGLTQQMSHFNELGSSHRNQNPTYNPFATNSPKLIGYPAVFDSDESIMPSMQFISSSAIANSSPVRTNLYQGNDNPASLNTMNEDMMH